VAVTAEVDAPRRVLIADDHPPTRAGVRGSLEADGFLVVAEVGDARKAVEVAVELHPDVCVLDIHMPGNGIDAAREIAHKVSDVSIVMLTASRDDDDLFEALRAGASGYLLKDMDPDRLGPALRGVLAGEAALPRSLAMKVIQQLHSPARRRLLSSKGSPASKLTSREGRGARADGGRVSTEQIAGRLFVSAVTVRTHVANVLKKLRVTDRAAAVRLMKGQQY
jgi:DNA-binding NarL/FixJ family response regulator